MEHFWTLLGFKINSVPIVRPTAYNRLFRLLFIVFKIHILGITSFKLKKRFASILLQYFSQLKPKFQKISVRLILPS